MKTIPSLLLCGLGFALPAFAQAPGSVDATFSADQAPGWIPQAEQADGKVLVGGYFSQTIARLNPDGTYDPSFAPRGISFHRTSDAVADWPIVVVASGGKLLVGMRHGNLGLSDGTETFLARLNSDGEADSSFRCASNCCSLPTKIIALPDGSVLVGQMRLKPDGTVDEAFQPKFTGCGADTWRFEAWQPDGRILLRAYSVCGVSVVRLLADGTIDPEFQSVTTDGDVTGVQVLADKRILVSGGFSMVDGAHRFRLARVNSDGSLDPSFAVLEQITIGGKSFSWDSDRAAVVQSDGKVVVSGWLPSGNPAPGWLARLNTNGSWDPSFSFTPTTLCCPLDQIDLGTDYVQSLLAHPDGSLWITAGFSLKSACCPKTEILRLRGDAPVTRLSIPSFSRLENRLEVRVRSDAADGSTMILESTRSMVGGWQPIATNALLKGTIIFTDILDTNSVQQFYRALLQ
jgi:uncharacterized delta-60 repeat protein